MTVAGTVKASMTAPNRADETKANTINIDAPVHRNKGTNRLVILARILFQRQDVLTTGNTRYKATQSIEHSKSFVISTSLHGCNFGHAGRCSSHRDFFGGVPRGSSQVRGLAFPFRDQFLK